MTENPGVWKRKIYRHPDPKKQKKNVEMVIRNFNVTEISNMMNGNADDMLL